MCEVCPNAAMADRMVIEWDSPWGWPGTLAVVVGFVVFNDLWFYGVHRLLHTRWLYRHVHSVHHRSVDANPMTSYSFHLVEAVLPTGWLIPVALLVPLPSVALILGQVLGLLNNVIAHLGFELLPARWTRWPLLKWTNAATYRSLHHQQLCHGISLLLHLRAAAGTPFVKGRRMTGFTNAEEDLADQAAGQKLMPFRIEGRAQELQAQFVAGPAFEPHAVTDGNLITEQQQNSGGATAELVLAVL